MKILLAEEVAESFSGLPAAAKQQAARSIQLLATYPRMYPVRRRGIMRGYRYFIAGHYLFYYTVSATEVRVNAVIPAVMQHS